MDGNFSIMRKLADREVLRMIAKISMGLSIISIVILGIIISINGSDEQAYSELIQVLWRTSDNLLLSVIIAGSVMITIVSIMTWMLCLYSSFRWAGPLYRLQLQLGLAAHDKSIHLTRLRNHDSLLLKMSYRNARESMRISRNAEKNIAKKIDNLIWHIEGDNFNYAGDLISDINNQLSNIKK